MHAGLAGDNAPTNSSFRVRSDAGKAPIRSRTSANWRRGAHPRIKWLRGRLILPSLTRKSACTVAARFFATTILLALHRRHARQNWSQHRHQSHLGFRCV